MEALGEELYGIIVLCYPELAPKLTGMILSLGEEECRACLDSQERLAERLDEAFRVLDSNGQCAKEPEPEEKRIDPEDGKARTFKELRALCVSRYSAQEIEDYWKTCKPVGDTGSQAPKAKAKAAGAPATAAPKSGSSAPGAQPATAAPVPGPAVEPDEAMPGLACWLRELKLSPYLATASQWIEEQGACSLDEVVENLEDFADAIGLKKLERKRLEREAEAAAKVAMEAAASAEQAPKKAEAAQAKPPEPQASFEDDEAAKAQRELEEWQREREELEREMEELQAREQEPDRGAGRRGAPAAKSSAPAKAKAKAPTVRVAPKAPAMTREEIEWNRENEMQEREFQKKQQARQAARDAEAAAAEAEEKRQARAREAEERQQRAAAELAAKVASASPGAVGATEADDFPALGGDWAAAGGKKGKKKR